MRRDALAPMSEGIQLPPHALRWYVAWQPGFSAILRLKNPVPLPKEWPNVQEWRSRSWTAFGGAKPTISDVSASAVALAQRWRDRTPTSWADLHMAPPLWVVVHEDGRVELTEIEPDADAVSMPVRRLEQAGDLSYKLLIYPSQL